jgi:hypothetical protein
MEKLIMVSDSLRLRQIALAAIANNLVVNGEADSPELKFLYHQHSELQKTHSKWSIALSATLKNPSKADILLLNLAAEINLTSLEILTIALAVAVEDDPVIGRVLARIQAPVGSARPTLGLLATAFSSLLNPSESPLSVLLNGAAIKTGLIELNNESAPLPERAVIVPIPLCLALNGHESSWPGIQTGIGLQNMSLAPSTLKTASQHAFALKTGNSRALVLRSGSKMEAMAVASAIANELGRQSALVETDKVNGLGIWLTLRKLMPVIVTDLGPSERKTLPQLPGYTGPVLAIAGHDGTVENSEGVIHSLTIEVPEPAERVMLWETALGSQNQDLAQKFGNCHRHSAGRIAQLSRLAHHYSVLRQPKSEKDTSLQPEDIKAAAWTAEGAGLDSLAEPQRSVISDEALVVPSSLKSQLDLLALRCRTRDGLADDLGTVTSARYRPGVHALLCGPSGTGKTLAASWLATHLSLPLYKIDLASVTSKYIGETEKNLSQLLSQAENAEVILLFDEADSLFGKRTDIRDSNDRFANAQTNYLLQRIESYDGIVLLTSNSRDRFDSAFTRRLDFILEFSMPGPNERRELWIAHLGKNHTLSAIEINQLAGLLDFSGGHIRNAVLTAAVIAKSAGRPISFSDLITGATAEYQKQGRQMPLELRGRQ